MRLARLLMLGGLSLLFSVKALGGSFEEDLSLAESLRVKNPPRTQQMLAELGERLGQASLEQFQRYQLLRAHQELLVGHYEEAEEKLLHLMDQVQEPNKRMRTLYLLAQLSEIRNDSEQSFHYMLAAADLYPKLTELQAKVDYLFISAHMYSRVEEFTEAEAKAQELVSLSEKGNDYQRCIAQQAQLAVFAGSEQLDKGFAAANRQIELCKVSGGPIYVADAQMFLGHYALQKGDTKQALSYYLEAKNAFDDLNYRTGKLSSSIGIAQSFLAQGNTTLAYNWANRALDMVNPEEQWSEQSELYEVLSTLAQKQGDLNELVRFDKLYVKANKALVQEDKQTRLAFLQARLEFENQRQRIQMLEQQNQVLNLQDSNGRQRFWLVTQGMLGAGGICLLLFAVLVRNQRQRSRLMKLAQTDPLTGLLTRQGLLDKAKPLYLQCQAKGEPLAIILADIDSFKNFNHQYGLNTGDKALRRMAHRLRSSMEPGTLVGRSCGAEFLILLPGLDLEEAKDRVRFCQRADPGGEDANLDLLMTLSFGLIQPLPGGQLGLEQAIQAASLALEKAKERGFNSIEVAEAQGSTA